MTVLSLFQTRGAAGRSPRPQVPPDNPARATQYLSLEFGSGLVHEPQVRAELQISNGERDDASALRCLSA